MTAGIIGFAFSLPAGRISLGTLAQSMGQDPGTFSGLGLRSRTFAPREENTFTLCLRAGYNLLSRTDIDRNDIRYCLLGSETPLYSVNPTSSMLADTLGIPTSAQVFDSEFACKGGTAMLQMMGDIFAHRSDGLGLVFAGDTGSGHDGDALAYTAGSAGTAFLIGNTDTYPALATIEHMSTYNTHRMDFWRGKTAHHPHHAGRWSGETYMDTVVTSARHILNKTGMNISDFDHVVLHMPNGKLPARAAKKLGATPDQMKHGWVVETIGNTYSACVPLGLCNVLAHSNPGEKILVVSYGSGAGSDAFVLQVTDAITHYTRPSVLDAAEKIPLVETETFMRLQK